MRFSGISMFRKKTRTDGESTSLSLFKHDYYKASNVNLSYVDHDVGVNTTHGDGGNQIEITDKIN